MTVNLQGLTILIFRSKFLKNSTFFEMVYSLPLRHSFIFKGIQMKQLLSKLAVVFIFGLSTMALHAEAAKRIGSGKSIGTQRQANQDRAPATTSPTAGGASTAAAAAPSKAWMGPVAGIAAGLGLAALASHLGFGEELASMVMMGLIVAFVVLVLGFVMRKRAFSKPYKNAMNTEMQYSNASAGNTRNESVREKNTLAYKAYMRSQEKNTTNSGIGSSIGLASVRGRSIPADFDTVSFANNAKANFLSLQTANDSGNMEYIRQLTTPELFSQIQEDFAGRDAETQRNNVQSLNAEVIEVAEDTDRYLVSVRFSGVIRDSSGEPDESFDEIWHLVKPLQGNSGWLLSGIQQTSESHQPINRF
jgi:predicted lipid-binding transport protein (Tim44 family)